MRPLTVITGILLGSCLSIAVSLALTLVVFLVIGEDQPRIQHEFPTLQKSLLIFLGMTIICAGSFYSLLINHRLKFAAQALMWGGLAATAWYFWPS